MQSHHFADVPAEFRPSMPENSTVERIRARLKELKSPIWGTKEVLWKRLKEREALAAKEDKFKELEGGGVDDELAMMKAKMLGGAEKKGGELPEGRPVSDAIESELEALRKKADGM